MSTEALPDNIKKQIEVVYGDWNMNTSVLEYFYQSISKDKKILELGSGAATQVLCHMGFSITSIEEDEEWLNKADSNYIHAPIKNGWYDVEVLKKEIPNINYDILIIDGPAGNLENPARRYGFIENINLFNIENKMLVVDDIDRKEDLFVWQTLVERIITQGEYSNVSIFNVGNTGIILNNFKFTNKEK